RRPNEHSAVMQNLWISRTHFGSNDPDVFRKIHLYENILIVDGAASRDIEVLRHFDDHVRLDIPSILERNRCGFIFFVTLGSARVRPCADGFDFGIIQTSIVSEVSVSRVRKPRRHLVADNGLLHSLGPRTRLVVGEERHRSNLARPVTCLAILLQYWQYV